MQPITLTVFPADLLSTARRRMRELCIRHLPVVVASNQIVGIITDHAIRRAGLWRDDFRNALNGNAALHVMTVQECMTHEVHAVCPETDLVEAGAFLLDHKIDCLPVVDDDSVLQGIITLSDLVRAYIELYDVTSVAS
jgi:acetoin utilization protein AcuB